MLEFDSEREIATNRFQHSSWFECCERWQSLQLRIFRDFFSLLFPINRPATVRFGVKRERDMWNCTTPKPRKNPDQNSFTLTSPIQCGMQTLGSGQQPSWEFLISWITIAFIRRLVAMMAERVCEREKKRNFQLAKNLTINNYPTQWNPKIDRSLFPTHSLVEQQLRLDFASLSLSLPHTRPIYFSEHNRITTRGNEKKIQSWMGESKEDAREGLNNIIETYAAAFFIREKRVTVDRHRFPHHISTLNLHPSDFSLFETISHRISAAAIWFFLGLSWALSPPLSRSSAGSTMRNLISKIF